MGALQAKQRVGVFLADTLAEPGAAAPEGKLGFVADNIRTERHEADRIKQRQPILAIMGNPPYRRLATGEVGKVGVAIDSIEDMERLFAGIALDKISTSMTINATASILLALYVAVARRTGAEVRKLSGTVQNDILKEYIARGT